MSDVPVSLSARHIRVAVAGALVLGLLAALVSAVGGADRAQARITVKQPPQPKHGPGGRDYTHRGVRVGSGGTGADAWYVFEPVKPRPKKAPLTVVMHGYYEFSGYASLEAFINHTARKGSIVIYPRWQTDVATPCPGPINIEPCITSAVNGINGALDFLRSDSKRVQPQLAKTSYFGFSFGGIVTANMTNRYQSLGLPEPRAIFLDDPHDGGLTGADEPALDADLGGIPSSTLVQCHSGASGVISGTSPAGESMANGSCNAVFPKLTSILAKNKDLVLTHDDDYGSPGLSSGHGVCASGLDPGGSAQGFGPPNAYDWNFCWKVWDALRRCALSGDDCEYALGNTKTHRSMGRWSDGTPIVPLKIQDAAPIAP